MVIDETVYLFDKNKELTAIVHPDDVYVNEQTAEINQAVTHVIQGKYTEDVEAAQFFGVKDYEYSDNFIMYKIIDMVIDSNTYTLNGIHVLYDDLKGRGGVVKDRRPENEAVGEVLATILDGTGWTVGSINTSNTITTSYYYEERLEAFTDLLHKGNVEYEAVMEYRNGKIIQKSINLYNTMGSDRGKWYEYGDKMVSVEKEVNNAGIYTAFIGRGKGVATDKGGHGRRLSFADIEWKISRGDPVNKPLGQDYVEIPAASAKYGFEDGSPRIGIIEFTDVEMAEQLLEFTYKHAVKESRPQVHFKAQVSDDHVQLGETVALIRDNPHIRYKTRIFKIVRDFKRRSAKTIEFGDKLIYTKAQRIKMQKQEQDEAVREVREEIQRSGGGDGLSSSDVDKMINDALAEHGGGGSGYGMIVVKHGDQLNTERPGGAEAVYWIGSVAPSNAEAGDLWIGGSI